MALDTEIALFEHVHSLCIVLVQDTFKKYIPVVNEKQSTSSVQINIPFSTGCGDDNICISELQLKSSFSGLVYVCCSLLEN
jgi:hypothetical protein